jgi:hypothetical protein
MGSIITFEDALKKSEKGKRNLLLGNGFSIACRSGIFNYQRLLEKADFSASPVARAAFDTFDTSDFERIVCALRDFALLADLYHADGSHASKDADATREILIQTIQKSHPPVPDEILDEEFSKCWEFLSKFIKVFTLNYDLLLYWTLMKRLSASEPMHFSDGFKRPEGVLEWSPNHYGDSGIYFLHGALQLYELDGKLQKYTWGEECPPILVQVASAIRTDCYPLFVCEGKSHEKLSVIMRSAYLKHVFNELGQLRGELFVFGHSLRDEDKHILNQIIRSKVTKLFIGVRVQDRAYASSFYKVSGKWLRCVNKRVHALQFRSRLANSPSQH